MTKAEDMHLIKNLRCPHCHAPVEPSWNLNSTGMVVCIAKCKLGKFLMDPVDCIDMSDEEEELSGIEDLE